MCVLWKKATVDCAFHKEKARHLGDRFRQMSRGQNDSFLLYIGRSKRKCPYSPGGEAGEENDVF